MKALVGPCRVVVTGGRDYENYDYICLVLDSFREHFGIELLIHGACGWDADDPNMSANEMRGADKHADYWARDRGVSLERVPAAWKVLGGKAGPVRNGLMLDKRPAVVIAFPGGKGTMNCARQARARSIPVVHTAALYPGIGWERALESAS